MKRRHHIRTMPATERIAFALEGIQSSLRELVQYRKIEEDRQQIFADFFSGLSPLIQKYVQDAIAPKHPFIPFGTNLPRRSHRKSGRSH